MLCEVFSLCYVRFLVLDLARLRLASWLASLATCMPRWACTKEKEFKLSCQQYLLCKCSTGSGALGAYSTLSMPGLSPSKVH